MRVNKEGLLVLIALKILETLDCLFNLLLGEAWMMWSGKDSEAENC